MEIIGNNGLDKLKLNILEMEYIWYMIDKKMNQMMYNIYNYIGKWCIKLNSRLNERWLSIIK